MPRCRITFVHESPVPKRRRQRLRGYDYSRPGAYFVTICTYNRVSLFGDVCDSIVRLNTIGQIVCRTWAEMSAHYPGIQLDQFIVMPNHLHGILFATHPEPAIGDSLDGQTQGSAPTSLPDTMRRFKTLSTSRIRRANPESHCPSVVHPVWQRSYYEHVIRNDESLSRIREYIVNNPAQWSLDRENPDAASVAVQNNGKGYGEKWMV